MFVSEDQREPFECFAILEILGHRRLAGRVTEQQIAGAMFVRIDIPTPDGKEITQFYSPSSVYCLTPTTETIARSVALHNQPRPVNQWELPAITDGQSENPEPF